MPAPLSTEKVLRTTLKALRVSGLIADDTSLNAIMDAPNNATDAELETIAAGLSYGNLPGLSTYLASSEDFTVLINSDGLPLTNTENYFRVGWDTSTVPITNAFLELFTVGKNGSTLFFTGPTEAVLGPRNVLTAPATPHTTNFHMAATSVEATPYYGEIKCGPNAVGDSTGTEGMGIYSKGYAIEFLETPAINVRNGINGALRGGWTDTTTASRFQVGDHENDDSLAIEVETYGGNQHFNIRTTLTTAAGRQVSFQGSNFTAEDANPAFVAIGGDVNATGGWGRNSTYDDPNLLVITPVLPNDKPSLYVLNRCGSLSGTEVVTIKTEALAGSWYYIRIKDQADTGIFNVDSTGDVNIGGTNTYNTSGADVAEWMPSDDRYDPGTVLVIRNGRLTESTNYEASGVAGVVTTSPGFLGNQPMDVKDVPDHSKVATIGLVPVKCSTARGSIHGNGELLVSGPDGHAVRASETPRPGTIIGKAMGKLIENGEGVVKGMVEVFVNLQ